MTSDDELFEAMARAAGLALRDRSREVAGDLLIPPVRSLLRRRRVMQLASGVAALAVMGALVATPVLLNQEVASPSQTPTGLEDPPAAAHLSWKRILGQGEVFGRPGEAEGMAAVTWDGRQFIAVGTGSNSANPRVRPGVWLSADGLNWTSVDSTRIDDGGLDNSALHMTGVAALPNGRLVAVGDRNDGPSTAPLTWHSDDAGKNWQLSAPPPVPAGRSGTMRAVAAGHGQLVAVGELYDVPGSQNPAPGNPVGAVWRTSDGDRWESDVLADTDHISGSSLKSVAFAGESVVAVGSLGGQPLILRGAPDQNWHIVDGGLASGGLNAVTAGRDGFLGVGSTEGGDGLVLSSRDGAAWTQAGTGFTGPGEQQLTSVHITSAGAQLIGGYDNGRASIWWRYNPNWVRFTSDDDTWPNGGVTAFAENAEQLVAVGYINPNVPDAAVWRALPGAPTRTEMPPPEPPGTH